MHGFFSNGRKCWQTSEGTYWPDLVKSDPRFEDPSIFVAGYYTDVDSGSYKISDCAAEVFDALSTPTMDGCEAPIAKPNIVFICHSLGGIVTRYMLEHNREAFQDKAVALFLIASPSFGSDYATNLRLLIKFYSNGIAAQLQSANESLCDLDERFRALIEQKKLPRFVGAEGIEHHFLLHWKWLPAIRPLVEKASAARYFGPGKTLANTDHSSCVKPTSHEHVSHCFLVKSYIEKFIPIKLKSDTKARHAIHQTIEDVTGGRSMESSVLFEIYDAHVEPYYAVREIDKHFEDWLSLFCVWVHGESGMGKTSSVRREIIGKSKRPIQAYIGAATNESNGHLGLLKEIYYTVTAKLDVPHKRLEESQQVVSELSTILSRYVIDSNLVLALDEVPLLVNQREEMTKFILSIINLVVQIKQKTGRQDVRIVVTSIFDPELFLPSLQNKINEQIRFLRFGTWTKEELTALLTLIERGLPELTFNESEKMAIVDNAEGCPRFVKTLCKVHLVMRKNGLRSLETSISETRQLLGFPRQ